MIIGNSDYDKWDDLVSPANDTKEIEVKLLQLKFLVEGLEVAEVQHIEGTKALQFRLSHFRKRIKPSDLKKFDKFFFGKSLDDNIVIDKSSLDMLKGSVVDFSEELIGESFKISNPKTKSSCGCGISFSF